MKSLSLNIFVCQYAEQYSAPPATYPRYENMNLLKTEHEDVVGLKKQQLQFSVGMRFLVK